MSHAKVIDFAAAGEPNRPPTARVRILMEFAERLASGGIRQVTMTDLALRLGMSKKTLYENFSNKEDVLRTLVQLWIDGFLGRMSDAQLTADGAYELTHAMALAHMDSIECFSELCWQELARDFPDIHALVAQALAQANRETRMALQKFLRPGVAPRVAVETYLAMIARASDSGACQRANMTPRQLTMAALEIWSKGALIERGEVNQGASTQDADRHGGRAE